MYRRFLSYRQTANLDLDDPITTVLRRNILSKNALLRKVYGSWSAEILGEIPQTKGEILELGTVAGFLKDIPSAFITTEV